MKRCTIFSVAHLCACGPAVSTGESDAATEDSATPTGTLASSTSSSSTSETATTTTAESSTTTPADTSASSGAVTGSSSSGEPACDLGCGPSAFDLAWAVSIRDVLGDDAPNRTTVFGHRVSDDGSVQFYLAPSSFNKQHAAEWLIDIDADGNVTRMLDATALALPEGPTLAFASSPGGFVLALRPEASDVPSELLWFDADGVQQCATELDDSARGLAYQPDGAVIVRAENTLARIDTPCPPTVALTEIPSSKEGEGQTSVRAATWTDTAITLSGSISYGIGFGFSAMFVSGHDLAGVETSFWESASGSGGFGTQWTEHRADGQVAIAGSDGQLTEIALVDPALGRGESWVFDTPPPEVRVMTHAQALLGEPEPWVLLAGDAMVVTALDRQVCCAPVLDTPPDAGVLFAARVGLDVIVLAGGAAAGPLELSRHTAR